MRARGVVARRLFAEGINAGDTNKLNESVKLDESVGNLAFLQSPAINGLPPIYAAVEKGKPQVVGWLIDHKAPVEYQRGAPEAEPDYPAYRRTLMEQPIHLAARHANVKVIKLLLGAGAAAEPASRGFGTGGSFGGTPLLLVLEPFRRYYLVPTNQADRIVAVGLLVKGGADPLLRHPINSTFSPLYPVLQSDLPELLDTLLTNTTLATARSSEGFTPLHIAASMGRTNAVAALISKGAALHATNAQGITPLQAAAFRLAAPKDYTRLSVRTNLIGVSPSQMSAVVEQLLKGGAGGIPSQPSCWAARMNWRSCSRSVPLPSRIAF